MGLSFAAWLALWLVDTAMSAVDGVTGLLLLRSALLTFPLATLLGLVSGALLGGLVWLSRLGVVKVDAPWTERASAWLVTGTPLEHASRIARVVALCVVTAACGYAAYLATHALVIEMARPNYIALSALAAHLIALVLGALLIRPLENGFAFLVARTQSMPWIGWSLRVTWRAVVLLLALALVVGAVVATRASFALSYLPWESMARVLAALCGGGILWFGYSWLSARLRLGICIGLGALCVAALVLVNGLGETAASARAVAEGRMLSGAVGYRALRAAFDYDGDGHLHIFGGGDCAPYDPAIHPGATDLPENKIDEDCDGEDLTAAAVDSPAGERFAVPREWPNRPAVVLITIDAFAATRMAAFGNTDKVTPNLDAFADRAMLFRACFAQGPSTRLSVPSMFTSRWDTQIAQRLEGKHPYPIDDSEVMLAEVLQKAGYDTSAVLPDPYFEPHHWRGITAGFRSVNTESYRRDRSSHNAATVTDIALAEIQKPRTKPLFLWVHYYDAHSPHILPEGARSRGRTPSQIYDAELSLVDREVGRLLKGLDADPKGAPLVVLTADHGIDFTPTHHEKFNYGYDLYSSVLHVPLIVRVPGGPVGRREHVVSTMDIAPTLVNALRLNGRFPFQGLSLVRELASDYENPSRRLVHQFYIFENYWKDQDPLEKIALRTDRFNLIHDRRKGTYELYDWRADYFEAQDLIDEPDVAADLKDLRKQLAFFTYSLHRRPAPTPGIPAPRRRP